MSRPKTRGDCAGAERPCPYVTCRHHLLLEVGERYTGHRHVGRDGSFSILEESDERILEILEAMPQTCALDVADAGEATLEEVSVVLGVSRQRTSQLEIGARKSLRSALKKAGVR